MFLINCSGRKRAICRPIYWYCLEIQRYPAFTGLAYKRIVSTSLAVLSGTMSVLPRQPFDPFNVSLFAYSPAHHEPIGTTISHAAAVVV